MAAYVVNLVDSKDAQMTRAFTTLAFSPSVRATQSRYGSRERMQQLAVREPDRAALSGEMQERLRRANSIIIGTASREGWPHVQHRGGPRGFIKVLAPDELAFADYGGNRQYITAGNLAENDRMFLLLMDYAERTRLKIWGRGEVIDDDQELLARVSDPDYPARAERVIHMRVEAWDTNCNSHIPHLLPAADDND
jgi:predicted pyridoxine 5'-phosphate oxidase superfamily flavin-nucleotide-binding protein